MTLYYNVKIWFNLQNYANLTSQTEKKMKSKTDSQNLLNHDVRKRLGVKCYDLFVFKRV